MVCLFVFLFFCFPFPWRCFRPCISMHMRVHEMRLADVCYPARGRCSDVLGMRAACSLGLVDSLPCHAPSSGGTWACCPAPATRSCLPLICCLLPHVLAILCFWFRPAVALFLPVAWVGARTLISHAPLSRSLPRAAALARPLRHAPAMHADDGQLLQSQVGLNQSDSLHSGR